MTDNKIIKALECCKNGKCITQNCPYSHYPYEGDECHSAMAKDALDLINRQKAEIEELKSDIAILKNSNINLQELYYAEKEKVTQAKQKVTDACKMLKTTKSEAIKEFAERLKIELTTGAAVMRVSTLTVIDNLVKEMVGDE